jgi:hypothetical protein
MNQLPFFPPNLLLTLSPLQWHQQYRLLGRGAKNREKEGTFYSMSENFFSLPSLNVFARLSELLVRGGGAGEENKCQEKRKREKNKEKKKQIR